MAKSQKNQTFVLKINTGYLSKNNWHLTLNLHEIRRRPQLVVSLGSSQVLRWMPELTGKHDADVEASKIKQEIKYLKKQGYKEFTPNDAPSTISQYLKAIEKIIDLKNYINGWTDIAQNIDTLLVEFDDGGTFADFGTSSHRTPINALCRFKDFLSTISHK